MLKFQDQMFLTEYNSGKHRSKQYTTTFCLIPKRITKDEEGISKKERE
jgi:hypothetical protein